VSRTGDWPSPFGVAPPKGGNALRFRLRLATVRGIGEIRRTISSNDVRFLEADLNEAARAADATRA
jgi:hypothetical protein